VSLTGLSLSSLPTGFVPSEDQGYLFVNVQLPDAASKQRTVEVMQQLDEIYKQTPGVANTLSISGYSLLGGYAGSNLGFSVVILEPWGERKDETESLQAILASLREKFKTVQSAIVFPFTPPPIDGLGNAGGFQMELQDRGDGSYS
jgi:HAE1 family hydrophobic/amphiphilic exporter-1